MRFISGVIPRKPSMEKQHQKDLLSDNWHTRKMAEIEDKSNDALYFIWNDAYEAAVSAKSIGNFEAEGRYMDERYYAGMEIRRRLDAVK